MASAQNAVLVSGVLLCLVAASTYALPMRAHSVFSAPQGLSVLGSENAESSVDDAAATRDRRGLLGGGSPLSTLGSLTGDASQQSVGSGLGSSLGNGLTGVVGGTKQQSQGVSSQDATNNANIDGVTTKVQSIKEGLSNTEKIQNTAPLSLPEAPLSATNLNTVGNPTNLADTQGISNIAGGTPGLSSVPSSIAKAQSLTENGPLDEAKNTMAQANSVILKPAPLGETPTRPSAIETFEVNSDADAEGDETASEESVETSASAEATSSGEPEASTEEQEED